jgi:hypothetical protein
VTSYLAITFIFLLGFAINEPFCVELLFFLVLVKKLLIAAFSVVVLI